MHTRLPCGYLFTELLQKLFSLLAVLSPLSTDILISVEVLNPIYTSPFILWLMVLLYTCRWTNLHMHSGWSDFAALQVAAGMSAAGGVLLLLRHPQASHTPRGLPRMSWRPLNHWQWLFVSSTTFPGVPRPHCCRIKDMHHSHDGRESEEPWGKAAAGCQNSPATPRANSSRLQPNCCELQVASGNRSSRGGSRPKDLIFISIIHIGHSEAICTVR